MDNENKKKNQHKLCPFCGEQIKAIAVKCRFCNEMLEDLDDAESGGKLHQDRQNRKISEAEKFSGFAISGFIFGILCIFFGSLLFVMQVLAIVFGLIGVKQTSNKKRKGNALAVIGVVLGIIYLFVWLYYYTY